MWSNDKKECEVTVTKNKEDNSVTAEFVPKESTGFSTIEKNIYSIDGTSREFEYVVKTHYQEDLSKRKKPPIEQKLQKSSDHKRVSKISPLSAIKRRNKRKKLEKSLYISRFHTKQFFLQNFLRRNKKVFVSLLLYVTLMLWLYRISTPFNNLDFLYFDIPIYSVLGILGVKVLFSIFYKIYDSYKDWACDNKNAIQKSKHLWNQKTKTTVMALGLIIFVCFLPTITQSPLTPIIQNQSFDQEEYMNRIFSPTGSSSDPVTGEPEWFLWKNPSGILEYQSSGSDETGKWQLISDGISQYWNIQNW